jgi:hypothetical protein
MTVKKFKLTSKTYLEREYVLVPYETEISVCIGGKKPYTKKIIEYWYTPVDELEEK